jgi:hypothetical protein
MTDVFTAMVCSSSDSGLNGKLRKRWLVAANSEAVIVRKVKLLPTRPMACSSQPLAPEHEREAQRLFEEATRTIARCGSFASSFADQPHVPREVWARLEELATIAGWCTLLDAEHIEMHRPARSS